ncbi:Protein of unknown function [Prevotella communis]|uniref:DUF3800 domain-containing protein n=1 Tax=Prevotella communis TaxID=2913614 RepID=A0A1H0D6K4_9BACT|nr:DUF3800 domain-containing protein [Prevotella communis]SDN65636.1 Protein of unknown function [Prevotella communis]
MVQKTFNIYCDESTHLENDKHPYMLYGYVSIASNQIKISKEHIKGIKEKYGYTGELKWTNIHEKTYPMYKELIEYFFMTDMKFRAVIVDKSQIDDTREDYTFNDFYFRMYFQLLHHEIDLENTYNIYFDIKDTCSQKKLQKLKEILRWNASIRNFQFIRSHETPFVQLADVLMGAINYNLRIEKGDIKGNVIAKRRIVEIIRNHTPISLKQTSPKAAKKFNLFFITLK